MYTLPLSESEYRALVELKRSLKYGDQTGHAPGAVATISLFPELANETTQFRAVAGWALLDDHKQVHGWHWIDRADPHWADATSAAQSFVSDTRHRDWLLRRRGYSIERDDNGHYLSALLEGNDGGPDV